MHIILVIEDDTDYRRSLIEILRLENYRILEAVNGLHGLEMLRSHSLDLIISDLEMPVMDGIELLRIVKEEAAFTDIPFILVTGHRDEAILKTVQELKPNACLFEPPNIDELLFTIDSCLQRKAS